MADVLPSHADAAAHGVGNAPRDRNAPANWPGNLSPNFTDWLPGDVVLVEAEANALGLAIRTFQAMSPNTLIRQGSNWSHCAIYAGNGNVIDCCYGVGVTEHSLWDYCYRRRITLRRLSSRYLPGSAIADIPKCARDHLNEPYSAMQVVANGLGWSQTPDSDRLYCGTFAALVIADATGLDLTSRRKWQPPYPSLLSQHPEFSPVSLAWRNV